VTAVFGRGLLTSEGEPWQRQRRLAAPAFAGRQLLAYDTAMVALTRQMLDGWKDGEVIDIHPEMMGLTLRIAAKTLFDAFKRSGPSTHGAPRGDRTLAGRTAGIVASESGCSDVAKR